MKGGRSFEQSFVALFRAQSPRLFRYMSRLTGDTDIASDLTQESFIRLYERGNYPDDVSAWLVTVATNLYRDHGRTSSRRAQLLTRFDTDAIPSAHLAADTMLEAKDRQQAVRKALATLPERDQRLLLLRHEGYSYQEIAKAIGVAASSVGTLLIRATTAFHAAYGGGNLHV